MTKSIEGGCHCSAVRYKVSGPVQYSFTCHCTDCQAFGGTYMAWLMVADLDFEVVSGELKLYHSSDNHWRQFCPGCGAQITFQYADKPEVINIATTTLDQPDQYPPTHHLWVRSKLGWVKLDDGLEQLETE